MPKCLEFDFNQNFNLQKEYPLVVINEALALQKELVEPVRPRSEILSLVKQSIQV